MIGHSTNKALSIIIPVYNEEKNLPNLLNWITEKAQFQNHQIIVVDGGSQDRTTDVIREFPKVQFYTSPKGRAKQMNLGAKKATNNTLYFLHVDSFPPKGFDQSILLHQQKFKSGCFRMQFDSSHWALRLSGFFTRFPFRYCRGGDQSLFIQKDFFFTLGGFNEQYTLCEDGELIDRIFKHKSFCVIPKTLVTSARKFHKNGVLRLMYHHGIIHSLRALGYRPKHLQRYYEKHIR